MNNKNLLIISPNFRSLIRNQVISAKSYCNMITVIVPQPYFPKPLLKLSYFHKRFLFIDNTIEIYEVPKLYRKSIKIIRPNYLTLPLKFIRKRVPILVAYSTLKELRKNDINFDIIHAHRLDIGFAGLILKQIYNKPLIITCHGSDVYEFPFKDDYCYAIAKNVLKDVDHVIAVCRSDAEKLSSLGLSLNKVSIIPNGIDETIFKPIPQQYARELLGLPLDKKIILSIGTLHNVKGHSYLIDAVYKLIKVRNDILIIIVGSGPLEMKLKEKTSKLGLNQSVLLVGWKPHNEIPLWLNASDVFILPSLNEGFPTVIPEAMACGKPVIGTRVGGIPDAISNESVGILVKSGDPESLAQGILEALNRKWDTKKIRKYAKKYSLENINKQIIKLYKYVINS